MVITEFTPGPDLDRNQLVEHMKALVHSDDLEVKTQRNQDDKTFELVLKVPIGDTNMDTVNRITALSVDEAL
jgi:hypothetical protein